MDRIAGKCMGCARHCKIIQIMACEFESHRPIFVWFKTQHNRAIRPAVYNSLYLTINREGKGGAMKVYVVKGGPEKMYSCTNLFTLYLYISAVNSFVYPTLLGDIMEFWRSDAIGLRNWRNKFLKLYIFFWATLYWEKDGEMQIVAS